MENLFNESAPEPGQPAPRLDGMRKINFYLLGAVTFLVLCFFFFLSAPGDFPPGAVIRVEKGSSLRSVSSILKREHIIRSRAAFEFFVIIFGGEKRIVSADYLFADKLPVWEVALRIRWGTHRLAPVSVTIPEGFDVKQIGDTFALRLTNFNKAEFLLKATDKEGYLFPDTYFFLTDANQDDVLKSMSDNFNKKVAPLSEEISSSGKTEKDIIIMSSIIEREAKGDADRGVISGILWKRIKIGMPLQADAAPETYKTRGLPDHPIGNPGLKAIKAALHPESSPYLYYLHDKDGNIHYAKSFGEHRQNILKYLDN